MNKNQLDRLIEQYIERFEELNSEPNSEGYKWETFQKFTDAWNIDSPDFKGMFEDAFKDLKSNNLLQSGQFQPVIGILDLLKHQEEVEYVRSAFRELFTDDGGDITAREKRIHAFIEKINNKTIQYDPNTKFRKQNLRSALFYLNLWKPSENYIFKATEAEKFAEAIEFSDDFGQGTTFNLEIYYRMCDEVLEELAKNKELLENHTARLEKLGIDFDDELHILVYDLMYCSAADAYNFYGKMIIRKSKAAERKRLAELDELRQQQASLKGEIIVLESSDLAYPDITGTKVHHKKFGAGLVKQCVDNGLVISFECGEKQLQYSVCVENGILDFESQNVFEVREKILENQDKLREYKNKLIETDKNIRIIEEKLK